MYAKPYLSIEQQIDQLRRRGMVVQDEAKAYEYLHRIGYYRLSAYWHPMRQRDASNRVLDEFRGGTTFKSVTDLYTFDGRLRLITLDALERIEIALRTEVSLTLGARDPRAHRDAAFLDGKFCETKGEGRSRHQRWLEKQDERFEASKDAFVEHFKENHPDDRMPIWIAVELMDFGPLSHLISGMTFADLSRMGSNLGAIHPTQLKSWAHSLAFVRNVCAHHSRLWNKPLVNQPALAGSHVPRALRHVQAAPGGVSRYYAIACILQYMLKFVNPRTSWRNRFVSHIDTFPPSDLVSLASAGFPRGWMNEPLWQ